MEVENRGGQGPIRAEGPLDGWMVCMPHYTIQRMSENLKQQLEVCHQCDDNALKHVL
jgi:hypothetical protein